MIPVEPPAWLGEEEDILSLLHAVLDRFDRQPGEQRQARSHLRAEQYLPALRQANSQADQTWILVRELERLGLMSVRLSRRSPYDPEWKDAKLAFAPGSEATLRAWLARDWSEPAMQRWRRAVQTQAQAFGRGGDPLLRRRVVIPGRSPEEVVAALARIGSVQGPITLRQLSARVFWGDSKILDDRADLIAELFPDLQILARALPVSVFLPATYADVLFIENQDTYAAAASGLSSECQSFALVYASGFRGSAARIRAREGVLLHYAGPGTAAAKLIFEQWWFDRDAASPICWFWGDLDFAGMQILKSLKDRFPRLQAWPAGYEPMIAALRATGGEGGKRILGAGQIDPGQTGCSYADNVLLPIIRELGQMDQEAIVWRK